MNINEGEIQQQLDSLSKQLGGFETEMLCQLDALAEAIPEIYKGYARALREIVNSTVSLFNPNNRTGVGLVMAAEIGARSLQAYGEYKAAREHNRLLKKYLEAKRVHANCNVDKVSYLLPKIQRTYTKSGELCSKVMNNNYNLHDFTENTIERVSQILIKVFVLYRTNAYLLELCTYLTKEYKAWLQGTQTSGYAIPDYYLINSVLCKEIYGKELLSKFASAAESQHTISGKQIILLSDYQLSMMALGDKLCKVNIKEAHPMCRILIEKCGAHERYAEITKEAVEHVDGDPSYSIYLIALVAISAILVIILMYLDSSTKIKWLMAIIGISSVLRISMKGYKKAKIAYAMEGSELLDNTESKIAEVCGKVDRPDIDYTERSVVKSAVSGFFNK